MSWDLGAVLAILLAGATAWGSLSRRIDKLEASMADFQVIVIKRMQGLASQGDVHGLRNEMVEMQRQMVEMQQLLVEMREELGQVSEYVQGHDARERRQ